MSEIKTECKKLPSKTNGQQKDNHYIAVWEYAGELLGGYDLERNGELQYALFKWLRTNNTKESGGQCEDGFFDYEATVRYPCDKRNMLLACTTVLQLNDRRTENLSFQNDIAIIGNDSSQNKKNHRANILSFYSATMIAGYKEKRSYDCIVYKGTFFGFEFVTKSGKDAIDLLKKTGFKDNPITGIFFSTHGTPYVIDFNNAGNNLYIPQVEMKALYERTYKEKKWKPGKKVAYVDELSELAEVGIIAPDVTITLCGCLNGGFGEKVPENAKAVSIQWAKENKGASSKNIAWYISKAIPKATVIANKTQVDSGKGLNSPIMYRNGEIII